MQGTFVAHVIKTDDEQDQGILYLRLSEEGKNAWVKMRKPDRDGKFEYYYFTNLQDALNDARTLARCGNCAVVTELHQTPFDERAINMIVTFLNMLGELKVA